MKLSLKQMIEKRNSAKAAAEKIFNTAKKEDRNMNDKEAVEMNKQYRSAKTMNDNIKALKAHRAAAKPVKKIKKVGNTMKKEERAEKANKALGAYLRHGSRKELRDINPSYSEGDMATGGVTVPDTIDKNILVKLTEDAPVYSAVNHIPSVTGNLTLLKETDNNRSGFVGEAQPLNKVGTKLDKVTLTQKRVGAYTELTNDIMRDSAVNLPNYAVSRLTWGFTKALEQAILVGGNGGDTGDTASRKSFSPIVGHVNHTVSLPANFATKDILDMTYQINPQYLKNAMFIVSRPAFNQMGKLQDGNGQFLALHGSVSDKPGNYSFRGIPVVVSDVLNDADQQVILGDFNAGYSLMVKQGMSIQHITADTQQALSGGHLIVLSAYMDGAVVNPDAFVTAKVGK